MAGYKGHLRGGMVTALILIILLAPHLAISRTPFNIILLSMSILLGSLLPDIDHPHSLLGRYIPFISKPIYRYLGHRSLTHSLIFIYALVLIISLIGFELFAFGIGMGMLSHILLDLFWPNSRGVAFLYPFYKRRIDLMPNFFSKKKKRRRRKRKH